MKRGLTILFLIFCSTLLAWTQEGAGTPIAPQEVANTDSDLAAQVVAMQKLLRAQDSIAFADALSELTEVEKSYGIDDLTMEKQVIHNKRLRAFTHLLITITFLLVVFLVCTKLLEKRTKKANAVAEEALLISKAENTEKAKLQFEITNSIRTPLDNIISYVNTICEEKDLKPETKKQYGQIINNNCRQLLTYVQNVLELSRIEVGKTQYKKEPYDIAKIVSEEITKDNKEPGNSIYATITSPIPEAITLTDRDHLLVNLHSIFYSPIVLDKEQYQTLVAMSKQERGDSTFIRINIDNVPLAYRRNNDNNTSIRNSINAHLFISGGGSYDVDYSLHSIEIMVPLTAATVE